MVHVAAAAVMTECAINVRRLEITVFFGIQGAELSYTLPPASTVITVSHVFKWILCQILFLVESSSSDFTTALTD